MRGHNSNVLYQQIRVGLVVLVFGRLELKFPLLPLFGISERISKLGGSRLHVCYQLECEFFRQWTCLNAPLILGIGFVDCRVNAHAMNLM